MLYLIKKELTANVRYMLIGLVIFVFYAFLFASNGDTLFMLCLVILFYSISTTNLILDERYKIELLLSTLPVSRKDIVTSKYLLLVVIFIACFLLYTLLSAGSLALGYDKIPVLNLVSVGLGLFAVSLFNGIMLPLSFKFGAQSTRYVSMLLFIVMFILCNILSKFDFTEYMSILKILTDVQFSLLLFAAAAVISLISFFITYPVYEKKDF